MDVLKKEYIPDTLDYARLREIYTIG